LNFTPPDYSLEEDGEWATHYYCQVGAGLDFIVKPVIAASKVETIALRNFLDVGSGFGFAAHFASSENVESICIEPGEYGRIGSEVLEIQVLDEYLSEDNCATLLNGQKFDVVYSSEVIEHIPDVNSFIAALKSALSPNGLIILTTPNASYVDSKDVSMSSLDSNSLELLGYSQHCSIFSIQGMSTFLTNQGLNAQVIKNPGGLSHRMVVFASLNKVVAKQAAEKYEKLSGSRFFTEKYGSYLRNLKSLNSSRYSLSLGVGASFRLLAIYLNAQNLNAASEEIEYLETAQSRLAELGIQNHISSMFKFYKGQWALMSGQVALANENYKLALNEIRSKSKTAEFYSSSWSANILVPLILAKARTEIDLGDFAQAKRDLDVLLTRAKRGELIRTFGRKVSDSEVREAIMLDAVANLNCNQNFSASVVLAKLALSAGTGQFRAEAWRLSLVAFRRFLGR
jgi:SAM-dependent methyltransferase